MDSAYAKLSRAQKHLEELRGSVTAFRESDMSDEITHQITYPWGDSDPRAVVTFRLQLRAPQEWSVIMGDILTNLRAALDHAVYGHATARAQLNSKQRKKLYHPMCIDAHEWHGTPEVVGADGSVKEAKSGALDDLQGLVEPAVLAVIESNQPFNSSNGPASWHGLAILSGLVNRDKHRAVLEVPINVAELAFGKSNVAIVDQEAPKFLDGGVVEKTITVRRAERPDGADPSHRLGLFEANTAFLEEIDIPNTGERRAFLTVMETLVDKTAEYLDELKAAGC